MKLSSARLIPLVLLVATLAFSVRVAEVISGFRTLSGTAQAEESAADKANKDDKGKTASDKDSEHADTPATSDVKKDSTSQPSDSKDDSPPTTDKAGDPDKPDDKDNPRHNDKSDDKKDSKLRSKSWPDASDLDPELMDVRDNLAKDLAQRRNTIEQQEKALATREAMLKAGQDELDQKYRELTELRKQLENLLNQQSEEETARLKSLVRIYEGMKPADAARIFNTLDMNVLLDVLTNMSERKSAPILAAMDPERARLVTIMMAQQKKLPELPALAPQNGSAQN